MKKTKWFVIYDGTYTHISRDKGDRFRADEEFDTFTEAKRELVRYLKESMEDYKGALKAARSVRKDKVYAGPKEEE